MRPYLFYETVHSKGGFFYDVIVGCAYGKQPQFL